jgi:cytosine/adenosine deaminase-related metal-dependent hydrolase
MNVLRDGEIDALAQTGSAVVWHPGNFLFYGIADGVPCRMPELAERGIPLGFMTDAAKAWSFGEMAWVGYLTARMGGDYLSSERLLEMQTIGGARAVGLQDRIGSLEPGKRADIAVWRTDGLELGGATDPVAGLVFAGPHRVDRLYVGGEEVVRDGRLVRGDEDEIAREQRRQAERFAA